MDHMRADATHTLLFVAASAVNAGTSRQITEMDSCYLVSLG